MSEILPMKGKTILITGGTSGIGKETALALSASGAEVIITTRSAKKGEETCKFIYAKTGNKVKAMHCHMESFESIYEFSEAFTREHGRLHVLINNSGIVNLKRRLSSDGIEETFAVNQLAPFLLTHLLLRTIKSSAPGRIINVSSEAHAKAIIDFDDIESKDHYHGMTAYARSKLANILFTRLLSCKLTGSGVTVNCLHPGFVNTGIFKDFHPLLRLFVPIRGLSPAKGAATTLYLATSADVRNITGEYFYKRKTVRSSEASYDMNAAERLWKVCMDYTGKYLDRC